MPKTYSETTLPSGLRVIHERSDSRVDKKNYNYKS